MNKFYTLLVAIALTTSGSIYAIGNGPSTNQNDDTTLVLHDHEYELSGSITHHEPILLKGFSTVIIPAGDTLTINGDLEIEEKTKVLVEPGATIMVYGNLRLRGESEIRLEGDVHVLGALHSKHKAAIYGEGQLRVIGQSVITNDALVFGTSYSYIDSMVFTCTSEINCRR